MNADSTIYTVTIKSTAQNVESDEDKIIRQFEEASKMGWFNKRVVSKEDMMKKHVLKMRSIR